MNKLSLLAVGIIAAIVVLGNFGSLLALGFSLLVTYVGFHYFRKTDSTFKRFFWGAVVLIGLFSVVSNIPAFIAIIALLIMYYTWRKWEKDKDHKVIADSTDPFENFEREWQNITK